MKRYERKIGQIAKSKRELEKRLETLPRGKRIKSTKDDATGLGISTRLPGSKKPTEEERKVALEEYRKRSEEARIKYLEEHPPLELQMDKLLMQIAILENKYPNEESFEKMKEVILKTKEDHAYPEE